MNAAELAQAAETTASVLKVLAPAAEEIVSWFKGGPEPKVLTAYPAELRSVASLERARYRNRHGLTP